MKTITILALCAVIAACSSLTQADYDRLAAIPGEIKQVYDQAKALTDEAKDLVRISNERDLTDEERIRIGVLFERVQDLMAKGKELAAEASDIKEKAASGSFDWEGLLALTGSVLAALGIVRVQRGPAKPVDPVTASEIKHLDAATVAKLKELARRADGVA